jgi:LysR family glycine cleavage system transcriptional activator
MGRSLLVADAMRQGLLVELFDLRLPSEYSYWLVWPRRTARRKAFQAFRFWLRDAVEACCAPVTAGPE